MSDVQATPGGGKPCAILVGEDNRVNRKLIVCLLESLGQTAHAVGDGVEVLEALASHPYRLLLIDGQMPRMDGFQTTAEIRRRERPGERLVIVAMTARADEGDRERCLAAGMDDYLPKPIHKEMLAEIVERWLKGPLNAPRPALTETRRMEASFVQALRDLRTSTGNDTVFLNQLIETFVRDGTRAVNEMDEAVTRSDFKHLGYLAHTFKSSGAVFGAVRMSALCEGICRLLKDSPPGQFPAGVGDLVRQLRQEFGRVRDLLLLERSGSSSAAC